MDRGGGQAEDSGPWACSEESPTSKHNAALCNFTVLKMPSNSSPVNQPVNEATSRAAASTRVLLK